MAVCIALPERYRPATVNKVQSDNLEYTDGEGDQRKQQSILQTAPATVVMGDDSGVTEVTVPTGSLDIDTLIYVDAVAADDLSLPELPAGYGNGGVFRDISFENGQTQLNGGKAEIKLPYVDVEPPIGLVDNTTISIYDLQLCNYHSSNWQCLSSKIDPSNKQVKGSTDQFSTFGLLAPPRIPASGLTYSSLPFLAICTKATVNTKKMSTKTRTGILPV